MPNAPKLLRVYPSRGRREPPPSRQSPHRPRLPVGNFSNAAAVMWFLCLVLPALALRRLSESVDGRLLAGAVLLISLVTWFLFRGDKQKAQSGAWRTPESTLHLAELAGGWPAAFLAQRRYRHKIIKPRYQFFFWSIVFLHQYAALDFLLRWRFSRGAVEFVQRFL